MIINDLIAYLFSPEWLAFWKKNNKNISKGDKKSKAKADKDKLKADMDAVEAEIVKKK
jgi:hypothetical protein